MLSLNPTKIIVSVIGLSHHLYSVKYMKFSFSPKKLIKDILFTLVLVVLVYSVINYWRQAEIPSHQSLSFVDYQGQSVDLQQISENQAVLVYFWGSWCHVCEYTTPKVNSLAKTAPVVSIAVQSGTDQELKQYLQTHKYQMTTINDENGELFHQWQGKVTPSYLIIENGQMQQSFVGLQPLWLMKARLFWENVF